MRNEEPLLIEIKNHWYYMYQGGRLEEVEVYNEKRI